MLQPFAKVKLGMITGFGVLALSFMMLMYALERREATLDPAPRGAGSAARYQELQLPARFLPKWHDLCERTLATPLDAPPDLERLHALRDGVAGFSAAGAAGPPFAGPSAEVAPALSVDAARRVVEEFHRAAGCERPEWLD